MDRHGGPTAAPPPRPPPKLQPRVHQRSTPAPPRPLAPPLQRMNNNNPGGPPQASTAPTAAPAAATATVAPAAVQPTPSAAFTLATPRPANERALNEYVDAPLARSANASSTTHHHHHHQRNHHQQQQHEHHAAVTKQPQSLSKQTAASRLTADANNVSSSPPVTPGAVLSSSLTQPIICPACERCRCEQCAAPRPLPSAWLCGDACLCSAETAIDYMTCLCCVKALYYHCAKDRELDRDGDGTSCADAPCSCAPHRRIARWSCMAALAACLPCLCLYWPLRGCQTLCAAAYARHSRRRGCRCHATSGAEHTSGRRRDEKRLLDASTPPPADGFC